MKVKAWKIAEMMKTRGDALQTRAKGSRQAKSGVRDRLSLVRIPSFCLEAMHCEIAIVYPFEYTFNL